MKPNDFARGLTDFLGRYLSASRNLSANTVASYRDTFVLLLRFYRKRYRLSPERITLDALSPERIIAFLDHLESERGCGAATRNQRLAAIHSFMQYLQIEHPDRLLQCQRILAIPMKKHQRSEVSYLSIDEVTLILKQPNLNTAVGRRDVVLLSLLYDTGARVQEVIDLSVRDLRLDTNPPQVRLTGKGMKVRSIPIMSKTKCQLTGHLHEHDLLQPEKSGHPVFFNRAKQRLSRSGVRYLLEKYVAMAHEQDPSLRYHVSPHMFRHSRAMHLRQAGHPLDVIGRLLGHVDVSTTQIYSRVDMRMKEEAIAKVSGSMPDIELPFWKKDSGLMEWLRGL